MCLLQGQAVYSISDSKWGYIQIKRLFHKIAYRSFSMYFHKMALILINTVWKVPRYGVFSGPYFFVFRLNAEIYGVNLRIQSEYGKKHTRKNSVFGHFSRSVIILKSWLHRLSLKKIGLEGSSFLIKVRDTCELWTKKADHIMTQLEKLFYL